MIGAAQIALLGDGRRLHLHHGPIDIVALAEGGEAEVQAACTQAGKRFATILDGLVAELPRLREPVGAARPLLNGAVARRMVGAVWPHSTTHRTSWRPTPTRCWSCRIDQRRSAQSIVARGYWRNCIPCRARAVHAVPGCSKKYPSETRQAQGSEQDDRLTHRRRFLS